jgi:hypothetical protein
MLAIELMHLVGIDMRNGDITRVSEADGSVLGVVTDAWPSVRWPGEVWFEIAPFNPHKAPHIVRMSMYDEVFVARNTYVEV